ncbi:GNAT family N-acetyltransferase [Aneurinibacillus tyrosinisolvens]|uniref:GNAT family N-acetyltransferase n=1 Tax=Aneurinibacillus tyrosinisolvens TaxID=1443435 RepID=UPI00063F4235|nr:GNAT family N-acetyltransferase [Aneurinibacillus tyrosinisolvens]
MLIRSFRLGDYAHISTIWQETGLEQTETETLDALAKQLAWDSELVMIAEYEDKVAGVIVGTIDGARGYFYRLAVNPAYQNLGIGRKLVEALEKRFKEKGVTRVFIMVNQDNKKVIPFYSSMGYEVKEYITLSKKISS